MIGIVETLRDPSRHVGMTDRVERGNDRLTRGRVRLTEQRQQTLEGISIADSRERASRRHGELGIAERVDECRRGAAIADATERDRGGLSRFQVFDPQLFDQQRDHAGAMADQCFDDL